MLSEKQHLHQQAFRRYMYYLKTQSGYYKQGNAYQLTLLRNIEETSESITLAERIEAEHPVYVEFGIVLE